MLLTHYIVMLHGKPCTLIGEQSIHHRGVLVPAAAQEYIFAVEIPRGRHRKPNNWARSRCLSAIVRSRQSRRRLNGWALVGAHIGLSKTIARFYYAVSNSKSFRVVGIKYYHSKNESDRRYHPIATLTPIGPRLPEPELAF